MTWNGSPAKDRQRGTVAIPVSGNRLAQVAITFPVQFARVPTVTVSPVNNTYYNTGTASETTTGVIIGVNHIDGTAATTTVFVNWIADAS